MKVDAEVDRSSDQPRTVIEREEVDTASKFPAGLLVEERPLFGGDGLEADGTTTFLQPNKSEFVP